MHKTLKTSSAALCGVFSLLSIASAQTEINEKPLRVLLPFADGDGACFASNNSAQLSPGAQAYFSVLSNRFYDDFELCLGGDEENALDRVNFGDVDMAWMTSETVNGSDTTDLNIRAVLTLRDKNYLGRVPITVYTNENSAPVSEDAPLLDGRIGILNLKPVALHKDKALEVLKGLGVSSVEIENAKLFDTFEEMELALVANEIQIAAIDPWTAGRNCFSFLAGDKPCEGLVYLGEHRPVASEAFVVSNNLEKEFLYRLVGIHIGLHLESPDAFNWVSRGMGSEFDAAEAQALGTTS